ncbi:MAG TPA: SIR2 family protein, partial [Gemmatimonadaceae bacterium]|nr:SIR2 family protein [Gemmatimonadaceae bacterium]
MRPAELLDTEHDRTAFERLAGCVAAGNALALVGAGFSARAGYPQWNELLQRMTDMVEEHAKSVAPQGAATVRALPETLAKYDDVLWRAEELRDRLHDDRYFALIESVFEVAPEQDDCIDMLVRLPFRHIITTNYDRSLELAYEKMRKEKIEAVNWADEQEVLRMMFSLVQHDASPRLVYLHGRADECRTIVLTDQDYSRQYVRSDATVRKLFALFAMHRIVFFGFSLTDPDLLAILRQVAGALGYGEPRHFAFVPIDKGKDREVDRKRLARKFGISAIFYDRANRHERLKELMRVLVERCEGGAAAAADRLEARGAEPATLDSVPTPSPVRP